MELKCPKCGMAMHIGEDQVGQEAACTTCFTAVIVPPPGQPAKVVGSAAAPPPPETDDVPASGSPIEPAHLSAPPPPAPPAGGVPERRSIKMPSKMKKSEGAVKSPALTIPDPEKDTGEGLSPAATVSVPTLGKEAGSGLKLPDAGGGLKLPDSGSGLKLPDPPAEKKLPDADAPTPEPKQKLPDADSPEEPPRPKLSGIQLEPEPEDDDEPEVAAPAKAPVPPPAPAVPPAVPSATPAKVPETPAAGPAPKDTSGTTPSLKVPETAAPEPAAPAAGPTCKNHPDKAATCACHSCKAMLCDDCATLEEGKSICDACKGGESPAAAVPPAVPVAEPAATDEEDSETDAADGENGDGQISEAAVPTEEESAGATAVPAKKGMSTGAKVGIGIGGGCLVIILFLVVFIGSCMMKGKAALEKEIEKAKKEAERQRKIKMAEAKKQTAKTPKHDPKKVAKKVEELPTPGELKEVVLTDSIVQNGTFDEMLGWTPKYKSAVKDEKKVESNTGCVVWERTASKNSIGMLGAVQKIRVNVASAKQLNLSFDVWVGHQSYSSDKGGDAAADLFGDDGKKKPEAKKPEAKVPGPVNVTVFYFDRKRRKNAWTRSFVMKEGVADTYEVDEKSGKLLLKKPGKSDVIHVPPAKWCHFSFDLLDKDVRLRENGRAMSRPATIQAVQVHGEGWDFKGAIGNLSLVPVKK